jgi:hypothetical protein
VVGTNLFRCFAFMMGPRDRFTLRLFVGFLIFPGNC